MLSAIHSENCTSRANRPLLELLAFFGLQRFRPHRVPKSDLLRYSVWTIPMSPSVAGVAVSGALEQPVEMRYEFQMLKRTEYMKAILQAQPSKEIDQ
jgi:CRISPR-associated protein Csb3